MARRRVRRAFGASDADRASWPQAWCESLGQVTLANGTVLTAASVQAGAFMAPRATTTTSSGIQESAGVLSGHREADAFVRPAIRVEIWLPLSGWNRKLQALGNGGLGGTIPYPALATASYRLRGGEYG
jgi:feruloyl esterase